MTCIWKKVAATCQHTDVKHSRVDKLIGNDNARKFNFDLI